MVRSQAKAKKIVPTENSPTKLKMAKFMLVKTKRIAISNSHTLNMMRKDNKS